LNFGKTVDEDGLKIPPTPIGTIQEPAMVVLDAIASHPLSPDDFKERIEKGLAALTRARDSFLMSLEMFDLNFSRSLCQSYVQKSHEQTLHLIGEFAHGHSEVQWPLENGEKLRLKLENTGTKLNLDFAGTTNLKDLHLTESHILGCAVRVLEQVTAHRIPVDFGSLLAFNVIVPHNSALSSPSPNPTALGVLVGANLICDLIFRALSLIQQKKRNLRSVSAPLALSFIFKNRSFFDLLASGSLATAEKRGDSGVDTWNDSGLSASVEDIEARFPLEIWALKKRTDSGGQGDQRGGDGILKTYRLLEPATLRWVAGYPVKPETNSNSGLGQVAEIVIRINGEETTHQELKGEIQLPAGAEVTALSRGGHAFSKG
jgi:N-methylhydantoinase B